MTTVKWILMLEFEQAPLDKDLVAMKSGFAYAKAKLASEGVPQLRPFNIGSDGEIDQSKTYYLPADYNERELSDYELRRGDLLFNNTSSLEVVGKSALVRTNMEVAFSNHITRLRIVDTARLIPEWLSLCLRRLWLEDFFKNIATPWIGQAGVNPKRLAKVNIPMPSVEIQREISDRYSVSRTDARAAAALVAEVQTLLDSLDSALLAELVPSVEQGV